VWPETTRAAILDAFHWGYMLSQVPSGWLAQRFGGKRVFGLMMLTSSLSTVLVPVAARTHLFLLLSLRFIAGVGAVRRYDTIRYDTRCYFNVRSKADISRLNLPHGNGS